MNVAHEKTWYEANQAYLVGALRGVRDELERTILKRSDDAAKVADASEKKDVTDDVEWAFSHPPALKNICTLFSLSDFERKLLLMCAGSEMDAQFLSLYAAAHKDPQSTQPTFSLAFQVFPDAHWSAITPMAPLRRWNLIELGAGETLATRSLRIQESVLHYLAGLNCIDERLRPLSRLISEISALPPSHLAIVNQIVASWSRATAESGLPIVQLCGSAAVSKREIAAAACARMGLRLYAVAASRLPQTASEIETLSRLWEREAMISSSAMLLECDDEISDTPLGAVQHLLETVRVPLILSTRSVRRSIWRPAILFDVDKPTRQEQTELWSDVLSKHAASLNGRLDAMVSQFNLAPAAIQSAALQAVGNVPSGLAEDAIESSADVVAASLWNACRVQARPSLEGLAQRIESSAAWDDLVLPDNQKQVLVQVAAHVRQRAKVYDAWGFGRKGSRGLGISALFAGPSGTGKTMAAEVLANELNLDLYRIDLSQIISKYIGETEKNLQRVFEAAEEGAAVLLFDEADALFGKRSEVKDSHDRYANIEVSYLLQRMESYRGLAILTTNRKSALDQAFLRRLRFVVEFPFPEAVQRAEIWKRVFPQTTPTNELHIDRLMRLQVSGGNIFNIAMGAAFLAADAGETVSMSHLLRSARDEFAKMEKPLPDTEVAGWV